MIDQLILMSEISIHKPSFQCFSFHEVVHLTKDSPPVLLRSLLSIGLEADGIENFSHALVC